MLRRLFGIVFALLALSGPARAPIESPPSRSELQRFGATPPELCPILRAGAPELRARDFPRVPADSALPRAPFRIGLALAALGAARLDPTEHRQQLGIRLKIPRLSSDEPPWA